MSLTLLNLSETERHQLSDVIGPLRSLSEFCSELIEATKDSPLNDAVKKLLPWAVDGASIAAGFVPLSKFVTSTLDHVLKKKETDAHALGMFACTIAYQRAAALAITLAGEPESKVPFQYPSKDAKQKLSLLEPLIGRRLDGFRLDCAVAHPFVWQADEVLKIVLVSAGYNEQEQRKIHLAIHDKFRSDLVELLSNAETAARFQPFKNLLELGEDASARASLHAHMERQRWQFEDRPLFNKEPFALSDIHVDTDCGVLSWKDLRRDGAKVISERQPDTKKVDPFSEECGGRHDLLQSVLDRLGDPKFNRAIVVQGSAGSGKSTFTLRLAVHLMKNGLRPIRIRLRRLDLNPQLNILDALSKVVVMPEEGEDPLLANIPLTRDPFLNGAIFQEQTHFRNAQICPYVLICDGWDEVSVGANEGFRVEVRRILERIDKEFLGPRNPLVRVILTGRPSDAVTDSGYLRDDTPILTMRPYTPEQLESYMTRLRQAVTTTTVRQENTRVWTGLNWNAAASAVERYRLLLKERKTSLDFLGLPLLAHLGMWLLTSSQGDSEALLSDETNLYRHLVDVTCSKAGKADEDQDDDFKQKRISGQKLRNMLHRTAAAITAYGSESIPFPELCLRLGIEETAMDEATASADRDHPLTALMISFYFKGGSTQLGCEFLHKSFREYLCAEGIVEAIKNGARQHKTLPGRRSPFHKDFDDDDENDKRYNFSREMAKLLSPQKMRPEIRRHLASLIQWEIERAARSEQLGTSGTPFRPLQLEEWEIARDLVADVWDWWAEGVHLRPQPFRNKKSGVLDFRAAPANELLDSALPQDRNRGSVTPAPGRLINMDANLGESLFELCGWIHYYILLSRGWKGEWLTQEEKPRNSCQRLMRKDGQTWVAFKPSGSGKEYFQNYVHRMNADGLRSATFPSYRDLRGMDLSNCSLVLIHFWECALSHTNLSGADLSGSVFVEANLEHADLAGANIAFVLLAFANMRHVNFEGSTFSGVEMHGADLSFSNLQNSKFDTEIVRGANLRDCLLEGADLRGANMLGAEALTIEQLEKTIGDASTVLPTSVGRPERWSSIPLQ